MQALDRKTRKCDISLTHHQRACMRQYMLRSVLSPRSTAAVLPSYLAVVVFGRIDMGCRVEKAGLQSSVLAWDIINEPEWAIKESREGNSDPKVALAQMQRFVGKCAAAIHRKGALATVGSARTSWNWENTVTAQTQKSISP